MTRESLVKLSKMAKPYLAVIFLQFGYAGLAIVVKFALNEGMSPYTYSVYRNVFAAVAVAPFAIFFERKVRPKMTISTFLKIMALGLVGALGGVGIMVGLYMVIWGKKHDKVPPESTAGGRVVPVDELPSTLDVKPPTNQEPSDTTTAAVAGDEAV